MWTAAPTDLYAILGVTPHATPDQLRHAYRSLLRQHHPDTRAIDRPQAGGAAALALQEAMAAYEVLRDPVQRADYDRLRADTSRSGTPVKVRVHRTTAPPANDPPLQAGPVRWHHRT